MKKAIAVLAVVAAVAGGIAISTRDTFDPAKAHMLVCGQEVRYDKGQPPAGCVAVCEGDGQDAAALVPCLIKACAPCLVTVDDWGVCPRCILTEGGCARACPQPAEPK
jgi:hypothetical protein